MKTILIQLKLSNLLQYIERYSSALDAMLAAVGFLAICYGVIRIIELII